MRDPGAPRLLFRPGTGTWHVADGERWFEPSSDDDLDALLSLLPAEVLDEQTLPSVGSAGGFVRVVETDDTTTLEFLSSFGEVVRRTANLIPGIGNMVAEWRSGAHPDGWVETAASLRLDGVRRCTLVLYLPEYEHAPELGDKEVAVQIPDGRRTIVDIHHLRRGHASSIEVYRSKTPAHGLELTLQTSAAEPADDDRSLGFVATSIEATP